ncbi:hypothetical protein [Rhodovibrio salinarum]|nr:hypothetical protein [Rhodovibrio salinarum]
MQRPDTKRKSSAATTKQPHWLAVVALLLVGLGGAAMISYVGSIALVG